MNKSLPVRPMTVEDCAFVCSNMREECFKETKSLSFANTKDDIAIDILKQNGESYTISNKAGNPVLVGGTFYRNPGVATIWLIATNEISHRDWWVTTKFITGLIEVMFLQGLAHRVQAESVGWRHHAHSWLQKIGLSKESQLNYYSTDGYDLLVFGQVKE
jgi:hypothetical protein